MMLTSEALRLIALGVGLAGFACLAWPVVMRLNGRAPAKPEPGGSLRSPLWWTGFVLTVAAIATLRAAG